MPAKTWARLPVPMYPCKLTMAIGKVYKSQVLRKRSGPRKLFHVPKKVKIPKADKPGPIRGSIICQ